MRTYLLLKERAAAFRADPDVVGALEAAQVPALSTPTLGNGEDWRALQADRSAYEEFDAETSGARSIGAIRLEQLAVEHLLGAR
jgi:xylose isomerase